MTTATALPGMKRNEDPARSRSAPTRRTKPTGEGWTHLVGPGSVGIPVSPDLEVETLVDRLAQALRDSGHLERLDGDGLKDRVASLRRLAGLADAGMAAAVAALHSSGTVAADGAPSPAAWLKANCNRSGRDAARTARLAEHFDELPATARALSDGRITAEAADAIVRATRDIELGEPHQVEADLAAVASTVDPAGLRRHIDRQRQAARGDTMLRDERRQHAVREASMSRDDASGMWHLRAKLSDEAGTRIRTALDAFDIPTDDTKSRPHLRMADALDAMATAVLDHGHTPGTGGITRPHLSVTVDHATLSADLTDPNVADRDAADAAIHPADPRWADLPAGTTAWGGTLSPQAVRRLTCDAAVSRIVTAGDSMPMDVGRATRSWSGPQRRAVNVRDRGCRGPSCDRPVAWTQVHHIRWWRHDGVTSVDNGLAVCHHCHHLVHDRGWTVALDPTTAIATWTSPEGRVVVTHPHRP